MEPPESRHELRSQGPTAAGTTTSSTELAPALGVASWWVAEPSMTCWVALRFLRLAVGQASEQLAARAVLRALVPPVLGGLLVLELLPALVLEQGPAS